MTLLLMAQSRAASVDVLYLHGASLSRLAISTSFVDIRAPWRAVAPSESEEVMTNSMLNEVNYRNKHIFLAIA